MTKLSVLLVAIMFPVLSQAGVTIKKYTGKDANGNDCVVEVKEITFLNNMPHPLNERVAVEYQGKTYTLGHPADLNNETGAIGFNHDELQTIVAIKRGAESMRILISQTPPQVGPTSMIFTNHDWKTSVVTKATCTFQ